ncbi:MAG: hypothetical protein Q8P67_10345 [archaeon]|nr:hypothetical protein [archaeon]
MAATESSSLLVPQSSSSSETVSDAAFPVETRTATVVLLGQPTDVAMSVFSDTVLLLITQNGKLSTWFYASADISAAALSNSPAPSFTVDTLLGRRGDQLLQVLPRQLVQRVQATWPGKSLMLSVSLRTHPVTPDTLRTLLALLQEHHFL